MTCQHCKFWFWYGSPSYRYKTSYRVCNHPHASARGLAPLKHESNGCRKYEQRRSLLRLMLRSEAPLRRVVPVVRIAAGAGA